MSKKAFVVDKEIKLSKAINNALPFFDKNRFARALKDKNIKVNDAHIDKNIILSPGDEVVVYYNAPKEMQHYDTIYEDDNILIVNKYGNIETHNTLGSSLFDELKQDRTELYPIHRLDRATTGLVVFAKNKNAERELLDAFSHRKVKKIYHAKVVSMPQKDHDILTAYLVKDSEKSLVKIYDREQPFSVKIVTEYRKLDRNTLEITLHTGKTHQIRAHLAHIGCAVVGDGKYGHAKRGEKLMLCAVALSFDFPENSVLHYLTGKEFKLNKKN